MRHSFAFDQGVSVVALSQTLVQLATRSRQRSCTIQSASMSRGLAASECGPLTRRAPDMPEQDMVEHDLPSLHFLLQLLPGRVSNRIYHVYAPSLARHINFRRAH